MTFKQTFAHSLNKCALYFLAFIAAGIFANGAQEKVSFEQPPVRHSPAFQIAKHDAECWVFAKEAKPANVDDMTGSVLVQFIAERDSGTYRTSDPVIHNRAWTKMLDKTVKDEGINVLGICL